MYIRRYKYKETSVSSVKTNLWHEIYRKALTCPEGGKMPQAQTSDWTYLHSRFLAWGRAKGRTEPCMNRVCVRPGDRHCLCRRLLLLVEGERTVKEKTSPYSALLSLYHPPTLADGLRGGERRWQLCKRFRSSLPPAWATLSAGDSSLPWAGAGAISSSGCAVVFGIKNQRGKNIKKRKTKTKKTRIMLEGSKRATSGERCRESVRKWSERGGNSGGETRGVLQLMLVFQSSKEQMELRRCVQGHVH